MQTTNPSDIDQATQTQASHFRAIRSYVKRGGRITPGQKASLENLWETYGLEYSQSPLDATLLSPKSVLEIGFGMGEGLLEYATKEPDTQFIGIEVHKRGVGHLMSNLARRHLSNVKVVSHDATLVLKDMIPDHSLSRVQIFFPDPWPKLRHHKRRLINPSFLSCVASKLQPGGILHLATDWADYHDHMLSALAQSPMFIKADDALRYIQARPVTRYQQRGIRLGHTIYDLVYRCS